MRKDGRALAFFNNKCGYSDMGMFIWTSFWTKDYNFGHISKVLRAADAAAIDKVVEGKFTLYATSQTLYLPLLTSLCLIRYSDDVNSDESPMLGGKLLALCDYMHLRAVFPDKANMDKVRCIIMCILCHTCLLLTCIAVPDNTSC